MAQFIYPPLSVDTTGLATEAKQDAIITELQGIDAELTTLNAVDFATEAKQDSVITELQGIDSELTTLNSTDFATEAKQDSIITELQGIDSELTTLNTVDFATEAKQDSIITELQNLSVELATLDVVDQLDGVLVDTSVTSIPASSGGFLEVVASTADDIKKIQVVEDIGSFIGLYTGPNSSEVLRCALPLGGGEVEVQIPAGTRVSLRALENTAINSGKIAMNLLG